MFCKKGNVNSELTLNTDKASSLQGVHCESQNSPRVCSPVMDIENNCDTNLTPKIKLCHPANQYKKEITPN